MGTQLTKNEPKSHKFTKSKNWAHQIYQQIQFKTRFTNTFRALLITRRPRFLNSIQTNNKSSLINKQISSKNYSQLSPKVL
jgi:hypothetical protein